MSNNSKHILFLLNWKAIFATTLMKKLAFEDASQFFFTEQSHHEIITAFQPITIYITIS